MEQKTLFGNISVGGKKHTIFLVSSDIISLEKYISYCDDLYDLICTIKNFGRKKNGKNIVLDHKYEELAKTLYSYFSEPNTGLFLSEGYPVLYKKDRDVLLCTVKDIIDIIEKNDSFISELLDYLKTELDIVEFESNDNKKNLITLMKKVYYNHPALWIKFAYFVKQKYETDLFDRNLKVNGMGLTLEEERLKKLSYKDKRGIIVNEIHESVIKFQDSLEMKLDNLEGDELDIALVKELLKNIDKNDEKTLRILKYTLSLLEERQEIENKIRLQGRTENLEYVLSNIEIKLQLIESNEFVYSDNGEIEFDYPVEMS